MGNWQEGPHDSSAELGTSTGPNPVSFTVALKSLSHCVHEHGHGHLAISHSNIMPR